MNGMRTRKTRALVVATVLLFKSMLPLTSAAESREIKAGDGMTGALKTKINEGQFNNDIVDAKQALGRIKNSKPVADADFNTVIFIWQKWNAQAGNMTMEQQKQLKLLIRHPLTGLLALGAEKFSPDQERKLEQVGILEARETTHQIAVTVSTPPEVRLPKIVPFPLGSVRWEFPHIDAPSALIQGVDNTQFIENAGRALLGSLGAEYSTQQYGTAMANQLFSGTDEEVMSRLGVRGATSREEVERMRRDIEEKLRRGDILGAMTVDPTSNFSGSMISNLIQLLEKVEINIPVFAVTMGASKRAWENARFYFDMSALIHFLALRQYKPHLSRANGEPLSAASQIARNERLTLRLDPTGQMPSGIIVSPEAAFGINLYKNASVEVGGSPTLLSGELGKQGTVLGQFRVSFKDESGKLVTRNIPWYYGVGAIVRTDGSVQLNQQLAAALGSIKGHPVMAFIDLKEELNRGALPYPPFTIAPGVQMNIRGTKVMTHGLFAPGEDQSTYGGGVAVELKNGIVIDGAIVKTKRRGIVEEKEGLGGTVGVGFRF